MTLANGGSLTMLETRGRRRRFDLNLKFADGSILTNTQNRDLFITAVEYLKLVRLENA